MAVKYKKGMELYTKFEATVFKMVNGKEKTFTIPKWTRVEFVRVAADGKYVCEYETDNYRFDPIDLDKYVDVKCALDLLKIGSDYIDKCVFSECAKIVNKIPAKIVKSFKDNGWTIHITTIDIRELVPAVQIAAGGVLDSSNKRIILKANAVAGGTAHEFGHYFDLIMLNYVSARQPFRGIYDEEKVEINHISREFAKFFEKYDYEYFAEAFNKTIIDPKHTELYLPKTYAYLKSIM